MRLRIGVLMLMLVLSLAGTASAQQTGEITGKVIDASGGVVPGVTVTLTGGSLLRPMTAVSSETGTYRFPQLTVGIYTVKFELAGFKTIVRDQIRIVLGFTATINATMEMSAVQETVTVTGQAEVVDLHDTSKTNRFTQEMLQSIPSARDPWVIIEQAAGIAMDRQNVGGSASGQQSNFVARGAQMREQKWVLDGVDITDMSATGGSPVYFDFDAFEEMQVTAGGADVTMQTPGVSVNLVTKSGTDKLRGSGRFYVTDDKFQSVNVDQALRTQGAATGNPIQNIKDYGFETGGPIMKGRAWFWGSYGKQNVNVGINNFYKASTDCLAMKAAPLNYSIEQLRGCLNSDTTLLNNYNAKVHIETFKNNQVSFLMNAAEKVRNARDASDTRPLETTYQQLGVTRADLGSPWWKTGMPKTYKWSDRHIFSDRFMVEATYAHVGNNFALTFHDESLRSVQPTYDNVTQIWGRSYQEAVYVRPTDSVDIIGSYFLPGFLGGDHSMKFAVKVRNDIAHTESMYGGDAYVRTQNGVPESAMLYRRGLTEYGLHNRSAYIQDSFSRKRVTLNLGLRFDFQTDYANAATVSAHPFYNQPTFAGTYKGATYTGAAFAQLPGISFAGAKAGVNWTNFSPRAGLTYNITGDGRNVVKASYGSYVGQLGTGNMSGIYNTVALTYVRYPWVDVNTDGFVQANEVVMTSAPLGWTTGYSYLNPAQTTTTGKVDPNLRAEKTHELMFSFERQLGQDFGLSATYMWRRYTDLRWNDLTDWGAGNYKAVQWTPPSGCPAGATCPEVTYYEPTSQTPVNYTYTNRPDYYRSFKGLDLNFRKRMSHNWMMNAGLSLNDAPVFYTSDRAYEDPTSIMNSLNGGQFAEESTSSGLGNVFVNAKWILRLSGAYQIPWQQITVAGFFNSRNGYPFIRDVLGPSRPFSAGQPTIYLDKRGDVRLPNFRTLDFRVDKRLSIKRINATAGIDVFNLLNGNTTLSMRGRQNSSTANTISSLLAPRVVRFGVRLTF